jgi:hypothetical protein
MVSTRDQFYESIHWLPHYYCLFVLLFMSQDLSFEIKGICNSLLLFVPIRLAVPDLTLINRFTPAKVLLQ